MRRLKPQLIPVLALALSLLPLPGMAEDRPAESSAGSLKEPQLERADTQKQAGNEVKLQKQKRRAHPKSETRASGASDRATK